MTPRPENSGTINNNNNGKEIMKDNNDNNNNNLVDVSNAATTNKGSLHTKSSFFLLNEKNSQSIPQVHLELENLSYTPITSTANANQQRNTACLNCCSKKDQQHRTTVLDNITTEIRPFELTAWMGPSGSGKTSLTSIVAGLVDPNDVQGTLKVNGSVGRLPKQMVGVVWQDDLLLSNLTVEETIYFAARIKTPATTSDAQVKTLVQEIMAELGLVHIQDNLIGSALSNMPGISGGERKRVAVAAELVVRPSLLLLDEPSSGLDSTTAFNLILTLKTLASLGHSIACVIHQPRTDIFKLFDHLLLLSKGRVIYNGQASCARQYLETIPDVVALPPETGIADWIMDTVIADEQRQERLLADHWARNPQKSLEQCCESDSKNNKEERTTTSKDHRMSTLNELHQTPRKYEASFWKQLSLLSQRTMKQRRGERLTRVAALLTFAYVFFTSFFWWRMPDSTAWVYARNSLLFFMLIAQGNSIVVGSISVFQRERALLRRERAKKMYGVLPFFLAKASSDMTNNILLPLCYGIITYWTAGLRPSFVYFLKFVLGYYLTLSCAQSMGFFVSILIPNTQIAMILAPPMTLFFFIIGGFYIPLSDMHAGIKWVSYVSFARYGYSALLVNEFEGRMIPCADEEVAISIGAAGQCPMPGDSVYESVGIDGVFASYWFNIFMAFILQMTFLVGAYGLLRRSK
ncbi:ABC-2 type transporter [Nitzschia inconspicua]|uniref:ABC-2 type transporter n=1 Tax=Nitzschia inconspicua TaxID=303405 RepID=A0A9K3KIX0_9STRA|nr:ABC-2 type transporter [Nitzschia inconspicua]